MCRTISQIAPLTWGAPCQCIEKLAKRFGRDTIPGTSREILYIFGRRSKVVRSLRSYGLYGSTAVLQYGSTVVRSMEEESKVVRYKVVHFAPTRSTPGGSADFLSGQI